MESIKKALTDAGIEVYRSRAQEIHIAERVRLHLMDSGVRLHLEEQGLAVSFTARAQEADFKGVASEAIFARVVEVLGQQALGRGYAEIERRSVPVQDPVDPEKVLDVWHEVSYRRAVEATAAAIEEVRWILALERYVSPASA